MGMRLALLHTLGRGSTWVDVINMAKLLASIHLMKTLANCSVRILFLFTSRSFSVWPDAMCMTAFLAASRNT